MIESGFPGYEKWARVARETKLTFEQ
jgi:hypothetical protein